MKKILILGLMLFSCICQAQKTEFYPGNYIRFLGENNDTLYNAFTGGLVNPMFSNIDLNQDGRPDLFVFDRYDGKVLTFISVKTRDSVRMEYAPQYESAFPKMLHWAILKDFNGDGKADIFMHGAGQGAAFSSHLVVFKNISTPGNLAFERYKAPVMKRTKNDSSKINTNPGEIPTFSDIDNDGDIDILQFDWVQTELVYYYKNMSLEKYGHKDSFNYILYNMCWGYFSEFEAAPNVDINIQPRRDSCNRYLEVREKKSGGHAGSTLLAFDHEGDGDKDLLVGDVERPNLVFLENGRIRGTQKNIFDSITAVSGNYPLSGTAAKIRAMPLASLVDINGNGNEDIVVSPMDHGSKRKDFIWLYNNTSKTHAPRFSFVKSNFIEEKMVDHGEYSHPAFLYFNNDSLPDLLISVQGEVADTDVEHLVLYLNVGTKQKAVFKPESNDFMGFSQVKKLGNIAPAIGDADGDGKADLLLGHDTGTISFYRNIGTNGQSNFSTQAVVLQAKNGAQIRNIDVGDNSRPTLADINNDGKADLLIGNSLNQIAYYKNITTTAGSPLFEKVNEEFVIIPDPDENQALPEKQVAPCLADIDQNGKPDLLVGTKSGKIYYYANISDTSKMLSPQTDIFYNFQSQNFGSNTGIKNTNVAVASLDQDGKPDLLIGNIRGGLYFMGSKNNGQHVPLSVNKNILPETEGVVLQVYPNPAKQNITLKWQNISPQNMHLTLMDISGRQVWNSTFYADGNASQENIHLPALTNGLYFLRITGNSGAVYSTQKLFIAK